MANALAEGSMPSADSLREALRSVIDPEAGMNIVDLGLVYRVAVEGEVAHVVMTMTSPACPMGEMMLGDVEAALRAVLPAGARTAVELTWSPPWDPSMMSDEARRHFDW